MSEDKDKDPRAYVVAECIQCHKTKKIYAGEVDADDFPMCDHCFMPMVALKASSR